jgi:hypothetical protein
MYARRKKVCEHEKEETPTKGMRKRGYLNQQSLRTPSAFQKPQKGGLMRRKPNQCSPCPYKQDPLLKKKHVKKVKEKQLSSFGTRAWAPRSHGAKAKIPTGEVT